MFKDNKFRIILDGVHPDVAIWGGTGAVIGCPPLYPQIDRKFGRYSITKKQYQEMVEYFYTDLDGVVKTIIANIQSEVKVDNNDW